MYFTKILWSLLIIILSLSYAVETRSYNNGLIFYNLANQQIYLPPTISVSRGRSLAKFKYSPRGSIWSTFGKPCDCAGPLCGCCVGIKVKQYHFDQKICANVTYAPARDEILMEVLLNDTSTAKYGIAARNPSPLCIPIMMGIPMSMCVQMSNVGLQGDNLNMCMDFMVRLASSDLFEMHFQCMQVGLQGASWVGPDGQPVIPANEGKIKDKSADESEEYYDESAAAASAENEIVSQEKEDEVYNESIKKNENNNMEDLNEAAEEFDYNDITEKQTIQKQEEEVEELTISNNNDIEKEKDIDSEKVLETEDSTNDVGGLEQKPDEMTGDKSKPPEKLMEVNGKPIHHEGIMESEMNEIVHNNMELVDANATNENPTKVDIGEPLEIEFNLNNQDQDHDQEVFTNQLEIEHEGHLENPKDEFSFEEFAQKMQENMNPQKEAFNKDESFTNSLEHFEGTRETLVHSTTPEKIKDIITESVTLTDREVEMPTTTEDNYELEMLINDTEGEITEISQTNKEFNNSLEILQQPMVSTGTEYTITMDMKPTMTAAMIVAETSGKTGIDNIDNALTTASTMKAATSTTDNSVLPASVSDNYHHHNNDVNERGNYNNDTNNDNDNSHENDSDYDDEESEEIEDETTEKIIETTNDAAIIAITKTVRPSDTNHLNNEKIITSSVAATNKDENDVANIANNNNESISSNDEHENDDKNQDVSNYEHAESEEYDEDEDEEDEYEDYDATTTLSVNADDMLTPSLPLNKTKTKEQSTNEVQMLEKNSLAITLGNNLNSLIPNEDSSKTLNVSSTSSQMPQLTAVPTATATIASSSTTAATTYTKPLPLARKLFALHQHQQRQQQKHRYNNRLPH